MVFYLRNVLLIGWATLTLLAVRGDAAEVNGAIRPDPSNGRWSDTWATMPQLTEPANLPPAPFVCSKSPFYDFRYQLLIFAAEPDWRGVCQFYNTPNPEGVCWCIADPLEDIECIWDYQLAHYRRNGCTS